MSEGVQGMGFFNGLKATDHVKSLEAAQEMLGAIETLKGRLNKALSDKVIETGIYQEARILVQQMDVVIRDFALHHERSYEKSIGFFNRNRKELGSGMLRGR